MEEIDLPPVAGPFIQSLRSVGYSLNAAIADLVDNSISAHAKQISIEAKWNNAKPTLVIVDNGIGMTYGELQTAMQLGGKSPNDHRNADDLGRFGLGLKTASFSQCKMLTVVSGSKSEQWKGLCWDLAYVEKTNKWKVKVLAEQDVQRIRQTNLNQEEGSGTIVVWEDFDQVIDPTAVDAESGFRKLIEDLSKHIELTFHRFLRGIDAPSKVSIFVNGKQMQARDPFAQYPSSDKQASTYQETVHEIPISETEKTKVRIRSFLLPHPSNVNQQFMASISGGDDYYEGQGLYIYRGARLISAGGWMKVVRKAESNKLARIQIDFENDADPIWKIDIKKSMVTLPSVIKAKVISNAKTTTSKSSRRFNGRVRIPSTDKRPIWKRWFSPDLKVVNYEVNLEHEVVKALVDDNENSQALIKLVERSLPIQLMKNDLAANEIISNESKADIEQLKEAVKELKRTRLFSDGDIEAMLVGDSNFFVEPEDIKQIIKEAT